MGQKAHPIGNRLGIIRGWDSNWYGGKNYSDKLVEDEKIRKYLLARLAKGGVSRIVIDNFKVNYCYNSYGSSRYCDWERRS